MAKSESPINVKEMITKIIELSTLESNFRELKDMVKNLTDILYKNQYLIYGDINSQIENSNLLTYLFVRLKDKPIVEHRNILRFINLFIKINRNLRNVTRNNMDFIKFLSDIFDKSDVGSNPEFYKYHIHIATTLLLDNNWKWKPIFNTSNLTADENNMETWKTSYDSLEVQINKSRNSFLSTNILRDKIVKKFANSNDLSLKMLYASCNEPNNNKTFLLEKSGIGNFNDYLRKYSEEFRNFYDRNNNRNYDYNIFFFVLRYEYTFDQICWFINYNALNNSDLRMNLYQSGFYDILSNIFCIQWLPVDILLIVFECLEIPLKDDNIKVDITKQASRIFSRLNTLCNNNNYNDSIKSIAKKLIDCYYEQEQRKPESVDNSPYSSNKSTKSYPEACITGLTGFPAQYTQNTSARFLSISQWGQLDVEVWLTDNGFEELREQFKNLSGRGLRQMIKIVAEANGRVKLLDLLTNKNGLDFLSALEFIGALEEMI